MATKNNKKSSIVEKIKKVIIEFNKQKIEINHPKETEILFTSTPKLPFSCFVIPEVKERFFSKIRKETMIQKNLKFV